MGRRRSGRRRCADTSVDIGCDACAVRIPDGAVSAWAPAAGSKKPPAKNSNIAAVLIRIMTPTQSCCEPHGLRLSRQRQLQARSNI
jgi:hypothetical protein